MARTWDDIERAAVHDPVLMQAVHAVRRGLPKELALIHAALWLSDIRTRHLVRLTDLEAMKPAAPIILCEDCPKKDAVLKAVAGGT